MSGVDIKTNPRALRLEAAGIQAVALTTRMSGVKKQQSFLRVRRLLEEAAAIERAREDIRWKG